MSESREEKQEQGMGNGERAKSNVVVLHACSFKDFLLDADLAARVYVCVCSSGAKESKEKMQLSMFCVHVWCSRWMQRSKELVVFHNIKLAEPKSSDRTTLAIVAMHTALAFNVVPAPTSPPRTLLPRSPSP